MSFKAQLEDGMVQLREHFMALQPRERVIVAVGAALVLITAIYTLGLAPLYKAVNAREARVLQKQEDLAWMQSVAPQLSALASQSPVTGNGESMVVLIANSAQSGNVASALTGQTPDGPNGVRVRFEGVGFDALVLWLGTLQRSYGVSVREAEITRAQPGQVNASLALTRG